jgi:hypothetical protein
MKKVAVIGGLAVTAIVIIANQSSKTVVAQSPAREIPPLATGRGNSGPQRGRTNRPFFGDAKRKRLFVSALGNNSLEVIDEFSGKVVHRY